MKGARFVYVDCNLLEGGQPSSLLRLIDSSIRTFTPPGRAAVKGTAAKEAQAHEGLLTVRDEVGRLQSLMSTVCGSQGRLCIVLDSFSEQLRGAESATLLGLRALRDRLKPSLTYVICVSQAPEVLRPESDVQPFTSLFLGSLFHVRPLDKKGSLALIAALDARSSLHLSAATRLKLYVLSGGHPGLLQILYTICMDAAPKTAELVALDLTRHSGIRSECESIIGSLSDAERSALEELGDSRAANPDALRRISDKGIVAPTGKGSYAVFSPVLAAVLTSRGEAARRIHFDWANELVYRGTQDITTAFSPSEHSLLLYLARNQGRICSKIEIAKAMWPRDESFIRADERIQKAVDRLRSKLRDRAPGNHEYIETMRGRGYRFVPRGD